MREMTLKEIQNLSLELLSDIHTFCVDSNIKYTIAYGTMIGAVRHQGFIPWDDDVDIWMPRPDFERFCREFKSARGYKLMSVYDKRNYQIYTRVYESEYTEVISPSPTADTKMGLWIDIMPLDGIPDDRGLSELKYKNICNILKNLLNKRSGSMIKYVTNNILYSIKHWDFNYYRLCIWKDKHDLVELFHRIAKEPAFGTTKMCSNLCCRSAFANNKMELLYTDDFEEYELIKFESIE